LLCIPVEVDEKALIVRRELRGYEIAVVYRTARIPKEIALRR
jgi:hypothetical protein